VLARSQAVPESAQATLAKLFADGERVIAVAARDLPAGASAITTQDERRLTLAGFLTFADRPKPDAGAAVAQLARLSVDVKIITGDNGVVAAKVCREIGIEVAGVLNGTDLAKLDDKTMVIGNGHTSPPLRRDARSYIKRGWPASQASRTHRSHAMVTTALPRACPCST
jgi:magnesium-transporting ATPase (P-type)